VSAALEVVAAGGLDGLTIRAVADRLGCAPMSLYRHVADRDELVARVVDAAAVDLDLPSDGDDVAAWLLDMTRVVRARLLRYPGVADHLMLVGPTGPHSMLLMDRVCGMLARLGRSAADEALAYDVLMTTLAVGVSKQLRGTARQVDGVESGRAFAARAAQFGARLPHLRRVASEFARDYDAAFERRMTGLIAAIVAPSGELFGAGHVRTRR